MSSNWGLTAFDPGHPVLTHIAQLERIAVADKHLPAQPGVVGMLEAGIGGKKLLGLAAGFFEDRLVAPQVGDSQRRQAVLLRAEQVAGAAELEVDLGQLEAVGRGGERVEPLAGLLRSTHRRPSRRRSRRACRGRRGRGAGAAGPGRTAPASR